MKTLQFACIFESNTYFTTNITLNPDFKQEKRTFYIHRSKVMELRGGVF